MTENNMIEYAMNAIRAFLIERPESADTLEGIHGWWIHWPTQEESVMVTLTALERLEAAGEVEKVKIGVRALWRKKR